ITTRDNLQKKSNANDSAASELARLKQQLLNKHAELYSDDKLCPLCGIDWKAHASMLGAVEERAQKISDALGKDGKALVALIASMTTALAAIETYIQGREAILTSGYNDALHKALTEAKIRLPAIQQLAEQLKADGLQI